MAKGRKTGGRQKSSLNKVPKDLRASITDFLQDNFNEVVKEWGKLDNSRDKLNFYRDLLKYAVPTIQSINITDTNSKEPFNLFEKISEINKMHIVKRKVQ